MLRMVLKLLGAAGMVATFMAGFHLADILIHEPSPVIAEFALLYHAVRVIRHLLQEFIPLQMSVIVFAFSFWIPSREFPRLPNGTLDKGRSMAFVTLYTLLITVLFTFSLIALDPFLRRAVSDWEYRSELSRTLRERIADARERGDLEESLYLHAEYLSLLPSDSRFRDRFLFLLSVQEERENLTAFELRTRLLEEEPDPLLVNLSAELLLALAQEYWEEENYPTANSRAFLGIWLMEQRAVRTGRVSGEDRVTRAQLEELWSLSWERLQAMGLNAAVNQASNFYHRKARALEMYRQGLLEEAYYQFRELFLEVPEDSEVLRFLPQVESGLRERALFVEEIRNTLDIPGVYNVLFLRPESEENRAAFVSLGKAVRVSQGIFFRDFEFLELDEEGAVARHFYAPYGRWVGRRVNFYVLNEDRRGREWFPLFLNDVLDEVPLELEMGINGDELWILAEQDSALAGLGLAELLEQPGLLEDLGYSTERAQVHLLRSSLQPFMLFVLSFVILFLTRRFRSRHLGQPPRSQILLLMVLPLVLRYFWAFLHWLETLLMGLGLRLWGWWPSLVFWGLALLVLFVVGLWGTWKNFWDPEAQDSRAH